MKTTYVDISNVVGCKTNRTFSIARNRGYDHLKHISSALLSIANRCKKDNHITDKLSVITNAQEVLVITDNGVITSVFWK